MWRGGWVERRDYYSDQQGRLIPVEMIADVRGKTSHEDYVAEVR
jgi:hypothetical protein